MHDNSITLMAQFFERFLRPYPPGKLLDVGSRNINGTYRDYVPAGWTYAGLDQEVGPNVDVVAPSIPWPFPDGHFDAVISGQCREHTRDPFGVGREIGRVAGRNAPGCLIAPWRWDIHRHPIDCWRILPDGMEILLGFALCDQVETWTSEDDCVGIGLRRETIEEYAEDLKRAGIA